MTDKEILTKIQNIISEQFAVSTDIIKPNLNLINEFEMDSLDMAEIMVKIMYDFHCHFTDREEDLIHDNFAQKPYVKTLVDIVSDKIRTGRVKKFPASSIDLYKKSVPELVDIIERQRTEIAKLRNQKKR